MWLPAVGAVFFLVVGLIWGLSSPSEHQVGEPEAKPPSSAAEAGAAP